MEIEMEILDELKSWISLELKEAEKNKRDSSGFDEGTYHQYNNGRAITLRAVFNKIDVLLENPATADKIASQQYALVNTVDSVSGFIDRGVYLFDSQEAASKFAVKTILQHCPDLTLSIPYIGEEEMLEYFHDGLESIEYFHIERVIT